MHSKLKDKSDFSNSRHSAARVGIMPGDLITHVNETSIGISMRDIAKLRGPPGTGKAYYT